MGREQFYFFPVHRGLALVFEIPMNAGIDACFLSTFLHNFIFVNSWSGLNLTPKVHI
jgi:hypothetical protein